MLEQFDSDFKMITDYYEYLVEQTKLLENVGITNEWIIDNYYLLVEHRNAILKEIKVLKKKLRYAPAIKAALETVVVKNHYNLDLKKLAQELNHYQKEIGLHFTYREIDLIQILLLFIYTKKLRHLCEDEYSKLIAKEKVEKAISELNENNVKPESFIKESAGSFRNPTYLFELNHQMNDLGAISAPLFRLINEQLEKEHLDFHTILNQEYQTRIDNNVLVSNIFTNLKKFFELAPEDLFKYISKTEKKLRQDPVYNKMTLETKSMYREKLIKEAKNKQLSEYEYASMIAKEAEKEGLHIGKVLFPTTKNRVKEKTILYLGSVFFLTIILCYLLSAYFLESRLLSFVILFLPINQILFQLANHLLVSFVRPKPLPKMDYTKGLVEESATMVVIPTILSDSEKVKEMFTLLETYYLVNKTNHLYFTLLGDAVTCDSKHYKEDEAIVEAGVSMAKALNKKYKKEIFFFAYRHRLYNEKEGCYLGYERKRGALLLFNRLLLGKLSKEEIKTHFQVHTLGDFKPKIRYVIPLDKDTELVLNTILNLVGAMAHPLNQPVLNAKKSKVIAGYAIMQPRVTVDIESTNSSLYSQIFASIGGFDSYTAIVPDLYQDSFGEGNFIGKGIYHLEVFDELLYEAFPDNLILSHDLLEGNYLRCAYVSDVEVIDGFPTNFLTEASRQHRWARGDTQIIGWLGKTVRNKKEQRVPNPLNILEKWKILDNILRMFLYPCMLLTLLFAMFLSKTSPLFWILIVFALVCLPIIFYLRGKLYRRDKSLESVYYKNLLVGGKSLLLRSYVMFVTIPYYTKLYMDAFFRTLYRLIVSKKNMLNWITSEEAEKKAMTSLTGYLDSFLINLFLGFFLMILGAITMNVYSLVLGLLFLSAPFVLYCVSQPLNEKYSLLTDKEQDDVREIAARTWDYFEENLTEENHYLIPDNYQENREKKLDGRTSPTDIGFSLVSIICAYHFSFITIDKAIFLLERVITSLESLEKWHGHLYNWYDIKTKKVMYPFFVSTIDSGNLVASLMVVSEFLKEHQQERLSSRVEKMVKEASFKHLYHKSNVFSIGYDGMEDRLSIYNYNKFASESRLTSYIAIAKGDVLANHWFCLDKSLTSYHHHKGLISWSGTSFEYFMPYLFMRNYPHTLLDESYHFAYLCQKDYMESINSAYPWGLSESAYDELDNAENYKYKAFSTPYLKAKEEKDTHLAIAPYASFMAMQLFPEEVYKNILKFKKLGMYEKYGFYESYDLETKHPVKAYFAHHQGMSLVSLANYLEKGLIQNYFHQNISVKTFSILLKEKVQVRADINMKIAKYKKYDYTKETIENDIRTFSSLKAMPEVSVLSNKKYCLVMNDRGNSFSRYRTTQLNRYRKVTEQEYGIFFYIKDLKTAKIWSNTYAPLNVMPQKYEVVFAADKIKFIRNDDDITTTTEIVVTRNHHAEIRKVTLTNHSDTVRRLELTTYTEPIITENMDDISHRVFQNMFLKSYYEEATNSLITMRKSREEEKANVYMIQRLVIENPLQDYQYETDRMAFLGRNHDATNPVGLSKPLTNHAGFNLEPMMSLRNQIEIKPNEEKSIYLITGYGKSREQLMDIIASYDDQLAIKKAFREATLMNVINTKAMNITGNDMRLFHIMLNYLYQTSRISINEKRKELLKRNTLTQQGLWKFGISGDRPMILIEVESLLDVSFVLEMLTCFEYYKNNSIFVDLVIVNKASDTDLALIKKEVEEAIYHMYTVNQFAHTPGVVKLISKYEITAEELDLLRLFARLYFNLEDHLSLREKVEQLQNQNEPVHIVRSHLQPTLPAKIPSELVFQNDFGGFTKDGDEYVIVKKETPLPWSNVIANKNMGTVVTNNGCGFTYAYNSGEFKITSWTNDMVSNDKSEGLKIDDEIFDPTVCRHGFGYTVLEAETTTLKESVTIFMAKEDTVKFNLVALENKTDKEQVLTVSYFINPVFGNFEEKTARHILAEFIEKKNYLKMRNVYHPNFSHVLVSLSASEKITSVADQKVLLQQINTKIVLAPKEKKELVFTLATALSDAANEANIATYNTLSKAKEALAEVKAHWHHILKKIEVKTNDKSFDFVMNGWYLYQAMSSRILGKTGFYQVSGAFGYRDQLQDTMNIVYVMPEITRSQILQNARHQFKEGDVLHWWHETTHFGLRSRYRDDYLWLVYATIEYVNVTGDRTILSELVPFATGEALEAREQEKGIIFNYSEEKTSLLDHCLRALDFSFRHFGRHGIPLMGGGDWNDGMNKVGSKGQGESVWLGFFLYQVLEKFLLLMKEEKEKIDYPAYQTLLEELKNSLNKHTWDGKYYLRAFFDNGDTLGSHLNEECKIDLISQSWAVLSGVASKERQRSSLEEASKQLVDREKGIVKLLTPAFETSTNNPGYIKSYPPGIRENGGQYTHAVSWFLMALMKVGRNEEALSYYQMINPINKTKTTEDVYRYQTEPYVIAADIYSSPLYPGHGGWTWYTGSAAWFYRVGLKEILGLVKEGDKLSFKPHFTKHFTSYTAVYHHYETTYALEVEKGQTNTTVTVDGKKQKEPYLRLENDKKTHTVKVLIGDENDVTV